MFDMKRREFISLLGGAAWRGRSRRARSSPTACGAWRSCTGSLRATQKCRPVWLP